MAVHPDEKKQRDEHAMFEAFLRAMGMFSQDDTVESRLPPEPDILFTPKDKSSIAFELVAIEDTDAKRKKAISQEVVSDAVKAYSKMPAHVRAAFGNAWISISGLDHMNRTRRWNLLSKVLPLLIERPRLKQGSPHCDDLVEVSGSGAARVFINRGGLSGPQFQPAAWLHNLGSPLNDAIRSKLRKRYSSAFPVSLLAHSGITLLGQIGGDNWRQCIVADFGEAFGAGKAFERLYIYDHGERKVLLCYPDHVRDPCAEARP